MHLSVAYRLTKLSRCRRWSRHHAIGAKLVNSIRLAAYALQFLERRLEMIERALPAVETRATSVLKQYMTTVNPKVSLF